jgi:WD40 repeat protein
VVSYQTDEAGPRSAAGRRWAFSRSDNRSGRRGTLKVWDAATGAEVLSTATGGDFGTPPTWSADGGRLAVGFRATRGQPSIRVHDAATGAPLLVIEDEAMRGRAQAVEALVFSPDGRRMAARIISLAPRVAEVKVWDTVTGQPVLAINSTGATGNSALAFGPDGHRLAEAFRALSSNTREPYRGVVLTVWDATPRTERGRP